FRARLARVTYVDSRDGAPTVTRMAMLVERDNDVADRVHGKVRAFKGARFQDLDPYQAVLVSVFEFLIANTDWSLPGLHNVRLVAADSGRIYYPVPYDFDWSGIVDAEYAKPDAKLGIGSVKERYYRGICGPPERFAPVFDRFRAVRGRIDALYDSLPGLDRGYVKETKAFVADFYQIIDAPGRWQREIQHRCRP
ncbi:MAG: hypothetical protein ACOY71_05640, partial [Gemmatimonadota bacterium]